MFGPHFDSQRGDNMIHKVENQLEGKMSDKVRNTGGDRLGDKVGD